MAITQTVANKSGLSQVFKDSVDTVPIKMTDMLGVNLASGSGDPNGLCTAVIGSLYIDVEIGAIYINLDGVTAWGPVPGASTLRYGKQFIWALNLISNPTVAGQVVTLFYNETNGYCFGDIATTTFPVRTGVTPAIVGASVAGLVQVSGPCEALVDGDTVDVAVGDFLEVLNTATAFVKDGAARTTVSAAVAVDANTGVAALKTVMLIPEQHTIAAT